MLTQAEAANIIGGLRLGIGKEDLGGGLKAIFVLENGFNVFNGTLGQGGDMFGRQAYVGLSTAQYGTVTLGRQYDSVVDFTGDLAAQVRAVAPAGVAAVVHLAGDPAPLADLLAPGGRIASTLGFGPDQLGDRDATATAVMAHADVATLDRLAADAAGGRLRVPVTDTYALEDVPKALAEFRSGTLGKLAVHIP